MGYSRVCDLGYYQFVKYGLSRGIALKEWNEFSYFEQQAIIIAFQKVDSEQLYITQLMAGVEAKKAVQWVPPKFEGDAKEKAEKQKFKKVIAGAHEEFIARMRKNGGGN